MYEVPTVKVKPSSPEQGDHVIINEEDFDEAVHTLVEPKRKAKAKQEPAE